MHVVVIGAGIVGGSVAYEVAKAGAKVTVIEASRLAGGSSTASFAWTNATGKRPRSYFALNVAGMRAHLDLAREFGEAPWYHQTGSLEWWTSPESKAEQIDNVRQMTDWGYGAEWIDHKRLAELEPELDAAAIGDAPIVYYPEEGWIDPALCIAWLLRAAAGRWDAKVLTGTKVTGIETRTSNAMIVVTDKGDRIVADAVINCTGQWAGGHLDGVLPIPMASTIGVVGFTAPVATTLKRQFHAEDLDVRPDGAGRLMIHKVSVDQTLTALGALNADGPQGRALIEAARAYLPALESAEIEAVRTTMRPITGDGFTCIGALPDVAGYYAVVTHSGVTLAPYLARAIADEVVHGNQYADLADFRPARLFSAAAPAEVARPKKRGNEFG